MNLLEFPGEYIFEEHCSSHIVWAHQKNFAACALTLKGNELESGSQQRQSWFTLAARILFTLWRERGKAELAEGQAKHCEPSLNFWLCPLILTYRNVNRENKSHWSGNHQKSPISVRWPYIVLAGFMALEIFAHVNETLPRKEKCQISVSAFFFWNVKNEKPNIPGYHTSKYWTAAWDSTKCIYDFILLLAVFTLKFISLDWWVCYLSSLFTTNVSASLCLRSLCCCLVTRWFKLKLFCEQFCSEVLRWVYISGPTALYLDRGQRALTLMLCPRLGEYLSRNVEMPQKRSIVHTEVPNVWLTRRNQWQNKGFFYHWLHACILSHIDTRQIRLCSFNGKCTGFLRKSGSCAWSREPHTWWIVVHPGG